VRKIQVPFPTHSGAGKSCFIPSVRSEHAGFIVTSLDDKTWEIRHYSNNI